MFRHLETAGSQVAGLLLPIKVVMKHSLPKFLMCNMFVSIWLVYMMKNPTAFLSSGALLYPLVNGGIVINIFSDTSVH